MYLGNTSLKIKLENSSWSDKKIKEEKKARESHFSVIYSTKVKKVTARRYKIYLMDFFLYHHVFSKIVVSENLHHKP